MHKHLCIFLVCLMGRFVSRQPIRSRQSSSYHHTSVLNGNGSLSSIYSLRNLCCHLHGKIHYSFGTLFVLTEISGWSYMDKLFEALKRSGEPGGVINFSWEKLPCFFVKYAMVARKVKLLLLFTPLSGKSFVRYDVQWERESWWFKEVMWSTDGESWEAQLVFILAWLLWKVILIKQPIVSKEINITQTNLFVCKSIF